MSAGRYNFTIEQGTTVDFTVQYKDDNGSPIALTDYSAQMQFRPTFADLTDVKYLTLSSSLQEDGTGLTITPQDGIIRIFISAEKSDTLTFDDAFYDLELYSGSFTTRLMQGKVKISKSVTR